MTTVYFGRWQRQTESWDYWGPTSGWQCFAKCLQVPCFVCYSSPSPLDDKFCGVLQNASIPSALQIPCFVGYSSPSPSWRKMRALSLTSGQKAKLKLRWAFRLYIFCLVSMSILLGFSIHFFSLSCVCFWVGLIFGRFTLRHGPSFSNNSCSVLFWTVSGEVGSEGPHLT